MFASRAAYISIIYLFIPILMWVLGWCQWWVAAPIVLLVTWGIWRLWPDVRHSYAQSVAIPWWGWGLLLLYAAGCVFLCGFDGRVQQSWDFIVRNPLYAHLIGQAWPTQLTDGGIVVYPLQFWLVPAALSKCLPAAATVFLQVWVLLGLTLVGVNVWQVLGKWRTLILLGAMPVIAPLTHVADDVLNVIFLQDAFFAVHFRLLSPLTQMLNTFHFYVVGCLVLSLLVARQPSCPVMVVLTVALAIMHPMLAVILFPWVLYQYVLTWKREGYTWRGVIWHPVLPGMVCAAAVAGIFYASSTGSELCLVFDAPHAKGYSAEYISAFAIGAVLNIIPLLFAWYYSRRGILLYLAGCIPLLTLFWMGQDNGISEWWYKYAVAYAFVLLLSLMLVWDKTMVRIGLCLLLLASGLSFLRELDKKMLLPATRACFAANPQFIQSQYADMNEVDSKLRKQFVSEHLLCPAVFRFSASEQVKR